MGQNCNSINKMQKKAIRTVTHSKYIAHSEPLLKDLNLISVKDLIDLKLKKFLHKFIIITYLYTLMIVCLI